jgi:carboxymethylenebutenolidase
LPIYEPSHVEYAIVSGHIQVVMDDGKQFPAYWSHPRLGTKFPGVSLIHDWWGVNEVVRRMAHWFAQMGHYVIVPDLFNGTVVATPKEAMALVETLGDGGYPRVHSSLSVLEHHHQCNGDVAAIGLGMGGSLAFEAAIIRQDLEAVVAFGGFPQRYLGRFKEAKTPVLAFYGSDEPYVKPVVVEALRKELNQSPLAQSHRVVVLDGVGHDFFGDDLPEPQRQQGRIALNQMLEFLEKHLEGPTKPKAL